MDMPITAKSMKLALLALLDLLVRWNLDLVVLWSCGPGGPLVLVVL